MYNRAHPYLSVHLIETNTNSDHIFFSRRFNTNVHTDIFHMCKHTCTCTCTLYIHVPLRCVNTGLHVHVHCAYVYTIYY